MKLPKTLLTLSAIAVALVSSQTWAGPILLDQSYDAFADGSTGGSAITSSQSTAQTFTVGLGGTLAQLGVQVQQSFPPPPNDLVITFLGVDSSGIPDIAQNLGSISVAPGQVLPMDFNNAVFSVFDVSSLGIAVSRGDVLAFELSYAGTENNAYFTFDFNNPAAYTGGGSAVRFGSGPYTSFSGNDDIGFQTFVAIPEPGSLALLGLGGIGLLRRRRI